MSYLVAPQYPGRLLPIRSSDKKRARYLAAKELEDLANDSQSGVRMPNGFDTRQFVEVRKDAFMPSNKREIEKYVKALAVFLESKKNADQSREEAKEAYKNINLLFEERTLTKEEQEKIQKSLNTLESYAKDFSALKQVSEKAKEAKRYFNEILDLSEQA